jgi:hypothetical protein
MKLVISKLVQNKEKVGWGLSYFLKMFIDRFWSFYLLPDSS